MAATLAGQWIGESKDGNSKVIIDLDDGLDTVRGTGRIFFNDGRPGSICEIELPRNSEHVSLDAHLYWIPHHRPVMVNTEEIRKDYPNLIFSETAKLDLKFYEGQLTVDWRTESPSQGSAILDRPDASVASEIEAENLDWNEFKKFALNQNAGSYIFRGQPATYKLRTAFHRTYRKDLIKYSVEDIPIAHRQLTARTNHIFNMENSLERGAFWNLLQHHGYPTPLLDWTYSPFVSAFFAYRRRKKDHDKDPKVRILAFNKAKWVRDFRQIDAVNFSRPHFSVLEALAIENPRAIPQQALSTLTNLDDIERYILGIEKEHSQKYIHAINLPADSRPHVMAELSLMGITAGSLFPGLDGACEELMGRLFHHQVPPNLPD